MPANESPPSKASSARCVTGPLWPDDGATTDASVATAIGHASPFRQDEAPRKSAPRSASFDAASHGRPMMPMTAPFQEADATKPRYRRHDSMLLVIIARA